MEAFAAEHAGRAKTVGFNVDQKGRGKTNLTPVLMKYRSQVPTVPTILIFRNGEVQAAYSGQRTADEIASMLEQVEGGTP